jgi:hypothetical protein
MTIPTEATEALKAAARASGKQRGWIWDRLSEREREKEIAVLKAALAALPAHGYKVLPRKPQHYLGPEAQYWFKRVWDAYPGTEDETRHSASPSRQDEEGPRASADAADPYGDSWHCRICHAPAHDPHHEECPHAEPQSDREEPRASADAALTLQGFEAIRLILMSLAAGEEPTTHDALSLAAVIGKLRAAGESGAQ